MSWRVVPSKPCAANRRVAAATVAARTSFSRERVATIRANGPYHVVSGCARVRWARPTVPGPPGLIARPRVDSTWHGTASGARSGVRRRSDAPAAHRERGAGGGGPSVARTLLPRAGRNRCWYRRRMLESLKPSLLPIVVGLGVLVGASWTLVRRRERAHRLAMALCACLGVWTFTLFGSFHDHGVFGHQNFHAHDFYHYYFGSKYLKEWGYYDMYLATVAGLEEVGRDEPRKAIRFERIRDLRGSAKFLYR